MNKTYDVRRFISRKHGLEYCEMPKSASNSITNAIHASNDTKPYSVPISFRFTFVRHPLARLVSAYVEKIQKGKVKYLVQPNVAAELHPDISIEFFVDFLTHFHTHHCDDSISNHWCPQSWIVSSVGKIDFVGCVENIEEDWKVVMRQGLGPLPHLHKTDYKPGKATWQQMLDKETETKARKFYEDDFNRWPDWWN